MSGKIYTLLITLNEQEDDGMIMKVTYTGLIEEILFAKWSVKFARICNFVKVSRVLKK